MEIFTEDNFFHKKRYSLDRNQLEETIDQHSDLEKGAPSNETFLGKSLPARRFSMLIIIMMLGIGILLAKTAHLQIISGEHYAELARGNRIRNQKIIPKRGIVYDSAGQKLVRNIPNFSISLLPIDLPRKEGERAEVLAEVSRVVGVPLSDMYDQLKNVSFLYPNPLVIKENLPYEEALLLDIQSASLPGVVFDIQYKREYLVFGADHSLVRKNASDSLSHILGYLGSLTEEELKQVHRKNYLFQDKIGKTGIEKTYEENLRGSLGEKQVEVDAFGKEKKNLALTPPTPGMNLTLTLDLASQTQLEQIVQDYLQKKQKKKASVIVLDPNNGAIKAMVSVPAYNNNDFAEGMTSAQYQDLLQDPLQPLFFRAISGMYPSGSTVKPIVAAAALNEGIITPQTMINSTGGIRINQWFFPDWQAGGHGPTNLRTSLAWSVNTYYYFIGGGYEGFSGLGADRLHAYLSEFFLGKKLGIDLPSEGAGLIPSRTWKQEVKKESWYIGDTYHLAIGQGDLLVTPLQVASWTAFFANGGTLYQPSLLAAQQTEDGFTENHEPVILSANIILAKHIDAVRAGLHDAVLWGSAQRLQRIGVSAGAKTGTAEWHPEKDPHAWFTAFAPFENPRVVITVLVEEGGQGSDIALDIAKDFLTWYFSQKSFTP